RTEIPPHLVKPFLRELAPGVPLTEGVDRRVMAPAPPSVGAVRSGAPSVPPRHGRAKRPKNIHMRTKNHRNPNPQPKGNRAPEPAERTVRAQTRAATPTRTNITANPIPTYRRPFACAYMSRLRARGRSAGVRTFGGRSRGVPRWRGLGTH